jgi:ubiquinone/menaquinone biosynthesis C-methylase UbiE
MTWLTISRADLVLKKVFQTIISDARIYDLVQRVMGCERSLERLAPYLAPFAGGIVLDAGAGTGNCARIAPESSKYIWLDNDPEKLRGFRANISTGLAILGDATCIALRAKSVDVALCVAVSHHLSDLELTGLFRELARVCRNRFIFVDRVIHSNSLVSSLLWKYDRGSYPRNAEQLCSNMDQHFELECKEEYAIYHRYLLCVGRPKTL